MKYLGTDVHVTSTVWHLLDEAGETVGQGKVATTADGLSKLVSRLGGPDELVVAQEVGKMSYFVHDVLTELGARVQSFNAYHLKMIAASRKKTDKRDAYWLAKVVQTGMAPHPVYIPTGQVRRLRTLLSRRASLVKERRRWLGRARAHLHAAGYKPKAYRSVERLVSSALLHPDGVEVELGEALELCVRMDQVLTLELKRVEQTIGAEAEGIDAVQRLKTIPSVGDWVAVTMVAWIGDVHRFASARQLASYAGLVPSVSQSGTSQRMGGITKQGAPQLRMMLVQAAHVLMNRCKAAEAAPLQAIGQRIQTGRGRRKIAAVAMARHLLRIAFYILRDETVYDSKRLCASRQEEVTAA